MPDKITDKLEKVIAALLKGTVFLLPLFFLPWTAEFFEFNKQFLLWLVMPLALFLWLFKTIRQKQLKIKTNILNLPILLFLLLAAASAVFSLDRFSSFFGYYGRFSDAWLGLLSLVIFYFLLINTGVADSAKKIYDLLKLFIYSALAAAAVSFSARVGFLKLLSVEAPNWLSSPWFNPAGGSLYSLGIFLTTAAAAVVGLFLTGKLKKSERYIFGGGLILIVIVLVSVNSSWLGLKPPQEAILDYSPALAIAKQALKASPFLGSGPGTFAYDFSLYRPAELNQNPLWQVRFDKSASQILELPATYGLLGLLGYFLIASLIIYLNVKLLIKHGRAWRTEGKSGDYNLAITLFSVFLWLFLCQIFFQTNTVLNFSGWLFLGLLVAFWQARDAAVFKEKIISLAENLKWRKFWLLVLFLAAAGWFALAAYEIKFFAADVLAARGADREASLAAAGKLNPKRHNYEISLAKFYLNRLKIEARQPKDKRDGSYLKANIASAIDQGRQAAWLTPNSVAAWETLGMIYRDASPLTFNGEPWAVESFSRALALEPTNPVLATELAKAYFNNDDAVNAEKYFKRASELKPDYYEAKFGLAKVYLKNQKDKLALDLLNQLAAATFDPEIFYELGRYYYNHGQIDKAVERFKLVLTVSPNHANGLYSLGIAYEVKGETAEALKYYRQVLELNPGNQEVINKIKSLKQ